MNERIKELMELASQRWATDVEDTGELDAEKFAVLIIKECFSIAWFAEQDNLKDGVPISKQIKERFGVK